MAPGRIWHLRIEAESEPEEPHPLVLRTSPIRSSRKFSLDAWVWKEPRRRHSFFAPPAALATPLLTTPRPACPPCRPCPGRRCAYSRPCRPLPLRPRALGMPSADLLLLYARATRPSRLTAVRLEPRAACPRGARRGACAPYA